MPSQSTLVSATSLQLEETLKPGHIKIDFNPNNLNDSSKKLFRHITHFFDDVQEDSKNNKIIPSFLEMENKANKEIKEAIDDNIENGDQTPIFRSYGEELTKAQQQLVLTEQVVQGNLQKIKDQMDKLGVLNKENDEKDKKMKETSDELNKLNLEVFEAEAKSSNLKNNLTYLEKKKLKANQKIKEQDSSDLELKVKMLSQEVEVLENSCKINQKKSNNLQNKFNKLEDSVESLTESVKQSKEQKKEIEENLSTIKATMKQKENEFKDAELKMIEKLTDLNSKKLALGKLEAQLKKIKENENDKETSANELKKLIEIKQKKVKDLKENNTDSATKDLNTKLSKIDKEMDALTKQKKQNETSAKEAKQKLLVQNSNKQELESKIKFHELEIAEIQNQTDTIKEKIGKLNEITEANEKSIVDIKKTLDNKSKDNSKALKNMNQSKFQLEFLQSKEQQLNSQLKNTEDIIKDLAKTLKEKKGNVSKLNDSWIIVKSDLESKLQENDSVDVLQSQLLKPQPTQTPASLCQKCQNAKANKDSEVDLKDLKEKIDVAEDEANKLETKATSSLEEAKILMKTLAQKAGAVEELKAKVEQNDINIKTLKERLDQQEKDLNKGVEEAKSKEELEEELREKLLALSKLKVAKTERAELEKQLNAVEEKMKEEESKVGVQLEELETNREELSSKRAEYDKLMLKNIELKRFSQQLEFERDPLEEMITTLKAEEEELEKDLSEKSEMQEKSKETKQDLIKAIKVMKNKILSAISTKQMTELESNGMKSSMLNLAEMQPNTKEEDHQPDNNIGEGEGIAFDAGFRADRRVMAANVENEEKQTSELHLNLNDQIEHSNLSKISMLATIPLTVGYVLLKGFLPA